MVAISGSVQPASASRVTAEPRRSLKVSSVIPSRLVTLPKYDLKYLYGRPLRLVRMIGLRLGVWSSAALSGAPTGITTRAPVLLCRNLIYLPS